MHRQNKSSARHWGWLVELMIFIVQCFIIALLVIFLIWLPAGLADFTAGAMTAAGLMLLFRKGR